VNEYLAYIYNVYSIFQQNAVLLE